MREREGDTNRLDYLQQELEPFFFNTAPQWKAESDKAWDAIHRALTDGKLAYDNGSFPLNHVILGGELLYGASDYIMSLKPPAQVKDIARALGQFSEAAFRQGYQSIDQQEYGVPLTEEDLKYSWHGFAQSRICC